MRINRSLACRSIGRLPHVSRLNTLIPALLAEYGSRTGTTRDLRVLCNDIRVVATKYDNAVSYISEWCAEAPGAQSVQQQTDAFARDVFPPLLLKVVSLIRLGSPMDRYVTWMFQAMMETSWVLQVQRFDWPPCLRSCRALVTAAHQLFGVLGCLATEDPMTFDSAIMFAAGLVYKILLDDSGEGLLTTPMLSWMCLTASRAVKRALNAHTVLLETTIPRALMLLVVSWHDLATSTSTSTSGTADSSDALDASILAVVVLSRCETETETESSEFLEFFSILAGLNRGGVKHIPCVSHVVRCLFVCSERYPVVSDACSFVVMQQIRQCSDNGVQHVSAIRCTIAKCLGRTAAYLRTGLTPTPMKLKLERNMMCYAISCCLGRGSTRQKDARVDRDDAGMRALVSGLTKPGAIIGMEALLRGTEQSDPDQLSVMTALSIIQVVLEASPAPAAPPHAQLHSLAVTMRKLNLRVSQEVKQVTWLVRDMIHVAGLLVAHVPQDADIHRMYVLVVLTLQPLLHMIEHHAACQTALRDWQRINTHFPLPQDLVRSWSWCAEVFAGLHGKRLLPGCGNLACENLSGALDSLLPTHLCAGCRRTRYCSEGCHHADWIGGHSRVCGKGAWSIP